MTIVLLYKLYKVRLFRITYWKEYYSRNHKQGQMGYMSCVWSDAEIQQNCSLVPVENNVELRTMKNDNNWQTALIV